MILQFLIMTEFISRSSFFTPSYLSASAWLRHIPFSFWLIERLQPGLLVELGVHTGSSYFSFCQSIKENKVNCICYGIDTWTGDAHAGYYDESIFESVSRHNQEYYSGFSYLLRSSFEKSLHSFKDKSIDLLHIDGFHTYESVKKDFNDWLPKLSDKAVVLLHDIHVRERGFGVHQLWAEIKQIYPSFEFSYGYGLGVLATGENCPEAISALLTNKEEYSVKELNEIYGRLGEAVVLQYNVKSLTDDVYSLKTGSENTHQQLISQEDLLEKRDQHIKLLEHKNEELFQSCNRLELKNSELISEIASLRLNCEKLISEWQIKEEKIDMLKADYNRISGQLQQQQKDQSFLQNEYSSLNDSSRTTIKNLSSALQEEVATSQSLVERLHILTKQLKVQELLITDTTEKEANKDKELIFYRDENARLLNMEKQLTAVIDELKRKYKEKNIIQILKEFFFRNK